MWPFRLRGHAEIVAKLDELIVISKAHATKEDLKMAIDSKQAIAALQAEITGDESVISQLVALNLSYHQEVVDLKAKLQAGDDQTQAIIDATAKLHAQQQAVIDALKQTSASGQPNV